MGVRREIAGCFRRWWDALSGSTVAMEKSKTDSQLVAALCMPHGVCTARCTTWAHWRQ